jgi:hypothetical protein
VKVAAFAFVTPGYARRMSRLVLQFSRASDALRSANLDFALIGGLALASQRVVRATQDIDLIVDLDAAEAVDERLRRRGYHCAHRSRDAANYRRGDNGLDRIYASRPIARRLLAEAPVVTTPFGPLKVVSAEGIIGIKIQAYVNDPRRTQDLADIRSLLRANRGVLRMQEGRDYFKLFDREALLDEFLADAG